MPRIDPNSLQNLQERIIKTNKVSKTHKGGKTASWNALVVVGDGEGHVGVALGKARAIPDAIRKGTEAAKKSLIRVPLVDRTIPHEVVCSEGACTVVLRPAAPGTGVVAGGSVRAILEAAGIQDVLAKTLGSHNAVNSAWVTIKALKMLKHPKQVVEARGIPSEQLSARWAAAVAASAVSSEAENVGEA
ncbi:MAG: 30S ribosomal protein S5 [Armatimonadota bacterium]